MDFHWVFDSALDVWFGLKLTEIPFYSRKRWARYNVTMGFCSNIWATNLFSVSVVDRFEPGPGRSSTTFVYWLIHKDERKHPWRPAFEPKATRSRGRCLTNSTILPWCLNNPQLKQLVTHFQKSPILHFWPFELWVSFTLGIFFIDIGYKDIRVFSYVQLTVGLCIRIHKSFVSWWA